MDKFTQNGTSYGYNQPSTSWRLTRRGKLVIIAALVAVDAILAVVLLRLLLGF